MQRPFVFVVPAVLSAVLIIAVICGMFMMGGFSGRQACEPVHPSNPIDKGAPQAALADYMRQSNMPAPDGNDDGEDPREKLDSDGDGLSDAYEEDVSHTDPFNDDSDGDGIKDGAEVDFQLDPNSGLLEKLFSSDASKEVGLSLSLPDEYGDSNADGAATLDVIGKPNIADVYFGTLDLPSFRNVVRSLSPLYELYLPDGPAFSSARLGIPFDADELDGELEALSIFQFHDDGTYEEVPTEVDADAGMAYAELSHFSKYFLGDKDKMDGGGDPGTQVFLLLDNSGSMYPEDMCEGSNENDVDFKRVDMAESLIARTSGDDISYGLAKFTGTYTELAGGFDNSAEELNGKLESIRTDDETFNGTYIATSLIDSLGNFDGDDAHRKFIVMLTDGDTTEGKSIFSWSIYDEDDAINKANEKNVSIIVIGLGNEVDSSYLSKIAASTGGMYVYANSADALDRVYEALTASLNYGAVDVDGDGDDDSILVADSGFEPSIDGFGFDNYLFVPDWTEQEQGGQCYGLASVAQLRYQGKLSEKGHSVSKHHAGGLLGGGDLQAKAYDVSDVDGLVDAKKALADWVMDSGIGELDAMANADKYVRDGSSLRYSDKARKLLDGKGIVDVTEISTSATYSVDGKEYTSFEQYRFNVNGVEKSTLSSGEQDAYSALLCINNYYARQGAEDTYGYEEYDFYLGSFLESGDIVANFNKGLSAMGNGAPLVLSGEGHAVNAYKVYRDIDNPLKYWMYVYDNNDSGQSHVLEVTKYRPHGFEIVESSSWGEYYKVRINDTDGVFGNTGDEVSLSFTLVK